MRILGAALVIATLHAPIQCSHDPDPSERTEDTAGDALWDLANDFEAHGDHAAAHHTLETLVTRYPSSRHAPAARDLLDGGTWSEATRSDDLGGDGGHSTPIRGSRSESR